MNLVYIIVLLVLGALFLMAEIVLLPGVTIGAILALGSYAGAIYLGFAYEDREEMKRVIDLRVDKMLEAGLLDEIRSLLDSGIPSACTAMQAIGYKEFVAALEGSCTVAEAAAQVQQASRHYAKRQLTWFRRDPANQWLLRSHGETTEEILLRLRQAMEEFDN